MWKASEVDRIRQLWHAGASFGVIAADLGRSRSAIAGKVYRLGLFGKVTTNVVVAKQRQRRHKIVARSTQPLPHARVAPPEGLSIFDLDDASCRWPIGPDRYCGRQRLASGPYCETHGAAAFIPAKRRA